MTIQVKDIKLLGSERLTDTDNGGGRMTGEVIESGKLNNLFPDISRLDRTYGRLGLRKAFMAVTSQDTDTYLGSHAIVTNPPNDPHVAVTMFTTDSVSDVRSNAQDRIESYVTVGPLAPYYLFGNQPKGAKAISLLGRVETPLPEVGDVLVISVETGTTVTLQQYVRVQDVSAEQRTFTDDQGDYARKVVTVTLTGALRATYFGAEASRFSNVVVPTRLRQTTIADASTYYGVSKLAVPAAAGALEVNVASITAQLVPATTRETAVAGASPGLALSYIAAGIGQALNAGASPRFQYRGICPGSLSVAVPGGSAVDKDGLLVLNGVTVGSVDYESGKVADTAINGGTYTPAATASAAVNTYAVDVTLANQGTVYVVTLPTVPSPGTLTVSFRYLGKWYVMNDGARDGSLIGATAAEGGGTIDYQSGSVTLTLGAIPDVDSKVLFAWGDPTSYQQHAGDLAVTPPTVTFQVSSFPVKPGSLVLHWLTNGLPKTATADQDGNITGDATGVVVYLSGTVIVKPTATSFPDSNAKIDVTYVRQEGSVGNVTGTYTQGAITFNLPAGALPVKPRMASGTIGGFSGSTSYILYWKDDGQGGIVTAYELVPKTEGQAKPELDPTTFIPIISVNGGSIDYNTGRVVIQPGTIARRQFVLAKPDEANSKLVLGGWTIAAGESSFVPNPIIQYRAQRQVAGDYDMEESVTFPGVKLMLTRFVVDPILPGSVWFQWGGKQFVDRQGKMFRDLDPSNGSAVEAGTIDYQSGEVYLTNYGSSSGGNVTLRALVTRYGSMPVSYMAFRTPGAPIRPSSFYVQAIRVDTGELITATSDANGKINGTFIGGKVENDMGYAAVEFGNYVPAAGNENEPWYSAKNVVGTNVWKPLLIDPSTVRFNCVVQTTLPLNADVLGIDPVRLPLTGRVPIFRDGDVIVVHEDKSLSWPAQVTANQVITLSGAPFGQFALLDVNGAEIPETFYVVNVDTGVVTMADSLAGLSQPLTAAATLEDMLLVSSVDLGGRLTLAAPLTRDYGAAALVSSALLFGDLQAQNPIFFSQQTWQGVWADTLAGTGTTAQYNRTVYPLGVVNADATTERFALIFSGGTGGVIVGETLGQIGIFTTSQDTAPINPLTSRPYFTLRKEGWGSGWGVNNVLRINTVGPNAPIWIARTVLPGAQATSGDSFKLQLRGDAA